MSGSPASIPNFAAGVPCQVSGDRLLPAIAQDATSGRVLMLAWMNEEAWLETLRTERAVYFSRSRGKLWRKGETSGHQQIVREVQVDCDGDTILLHVQQTGAACHEGYASCFFRSVNADQSLSIRESRLVDPADVYPSAEPGNCKPRGER